jgi:hypothetical protein
VCNSRTYLGLFSLFPRKCRQHAHKAANFTQNAHSRVHFLDLCLMIETNSKLLSFPMSQLIIVREFYGNCSPRFEEIYIIPNPNIFSSDIDYAKHMVNNSLGSYQCTNNQNFSNENSYSCAQLIISLRNKY